MSSRLSSLLIAFGIACLLGTGYLIWQRNTPSRLSFNIANAPAVSAHNPSGSEPVAVMIKELNIKLPIYPATLEDGKWEATSKGVSYLRSSPVPGERGNSILYGHNWTNLLGNLTKAKPGQEIEVLFSDGEPRRFMIEYTQVVTPDQTHILAPSDDRRVTLYTCTGFLDRKRFVVTATLLTP